MFQNPRKAAIRYFELIGNSDALIAIIIIIIIVFLVACVLIFYFCFFPDGVPEHLKEDQKESDKSEEGKSMMDKEEGKGEGADAANGNGTAV